MKFLPAAAFTALALVTFPALATAATAAVPAATPTWLAIAGLLWFAIDKIIDLLPIKENTIVQAIRSVLNLFLGKQRP